jgi:glutamate dehydrogenase (NAD(P)+)
VELGGSLGRTEATGYGVIYTLREALRGIGADIASTKASIQGFGNVAEYAARLYTQLGGTVVAVSSWDNRDKKAYTFKNEQGLDIEKMVSIKDSYGTINKQLAEEIGCEILEADAWISQDVDILLPCALENQITAETIEKISDRVKVICEGANGPTTLEADEVIKNKNILLVPDFLCNAGGVTCSYFEQVQCNMNYFWPKQEVLERLDSKMTAAFSAVSKLANEKSLYMRDAAYVIAINRVAQAVKLRGWV